MLLSRLNAASRESEEPRPTPLLPYDTVREFLETHPLVHATGVNARDVHSCLTELHVWLRTTAPVRPSAGTKEPAWTCAHCDGGRGVLDEREGHYACDACGAVLRTGVNVVREWTDAAQDEWSTSRHPAVRGVDRRIVEASLSYVVSDEGQRPSKYWDDLEHWNSFAHVGEDELLRWDHVLRDFVSSRHCVLVRIVACLLYARVRFPEDVRARLRLGKRLERNDVPVPEARFPCGTCGVKVQRLRDARFHCKWMVKRPAPRPAFVRASPGAPAHAATTHGNSRAETSSSSCASLG